jgi:hypothetical protein
MDARLTVFSGTLIKFQVFEKKAQSERGVAKRAWVTRLIKPQIKASDDTNIAIGIQLFEMSKKLFL